MIRITFILLIQFIVLIGFGQAWTRSAGKSFTKLDFSTIQSNKQFNNEQVVIDAAKLTNNNFSLYGEYGLTDNLTVVAHLPYVMNSLENVSKGSVGDADLALRYALKKEGLALSTTIQLGLPIGDNADPNALFTGDGEFNQLFKVNAGTGGAKWWTQAGLGFNNRSKGYSDEIRFEAELGFKLFSEKLLAMLKFTGIKSTNNGTITAISPRGLYANNVEYISPGIELLYYFTEHYGISLRGAGAMQGRNIQAAPQLSIGFFGDFK